jgi:hypothetical protein
MRCSITLYQFAKRAQITCDAVAKGNRLTFRAPERFFLKMPQNLLSYEKQICVSEGFGDQLSLCQPIEEGDEYELLNTMI